MELGRSRLNFIRRKLPYLASHWTHYEVKWVDIELHDCPIRAEERYLQRITCEKHCKPKILQLPHRNVVVSDLTYVRVGLSQNYICLLVDLFNKEIICYSTGSNKNAKLVKQIFSRVTGDLKSIHFFHTDRENEFKNQLIDETLRAFESLTALRVIYPIM